MRYPAARHIERFRRSGGRLPASCCRRRAPTASQIAGIRITGYSAFASKCLAPRFDEKTAVKKVKRIAIVVSIVSFAGIGTIFACHEDRTVRTEITIKRTPSAVWQVLTATDEYPAWNPMIDKIVGDLREGNVIEVDQGMVFHPTVLAVHPNQELRWKGYVWTPGLFDGDHRFILEAQDEYTRVIQTETFSGVLAGQLMRGIIDETVATMQDMNRALKVRAESIAETH